MNNPHEKELSELFANDTDALVDEDFVLRCVTSFRRAQRRLLALKIITGAAVIGTVGLLSPSLSDLAATISSSLPSAFSDLAQAVIGPGWLSDTLAVFESVFGGVDRVIAIAIVLVLTIRHFEFRLFRFRESPR